VSHLFGWLIGGYGESEGPVIRSAGAIRPEDQHPTTAGLRQPARCVMDFGVQFFPAIGPARKSPAQYWDEALQLTQLAEQLGYGHVRTVEHYFHPYGGYSPDPLIFLSAAAALTHKIRLITGAVLPVFNNPLKLAGQIGMVDAISKGRLEVGFARAFLPHEFGRFGISMDESRARFDEGLEQIRLLLTEENVTFRGRFHNIEKVTSQPRPTQTPRPPFWIAALSTKDSFENAGRLGHDLMGIPLAGAQMAELIQVYRHAWSAAGHPGRGRVMLAFHMFCAESREQATAIAREPLNTYLKSIVDAASEWMSGVASKDYPNYQKMIEFISKESFESQVAKGSAWIGTPDDIRKVIACYDAQVDGFESASLQVNFGTIGQADAERSMTLFAREVMPHFQK
jgi:alkanesulfonate monooxygenase SsuD/methylene tetrahydromethanopterin reductase-like flavin-dependent oxidoreductase (luciferase family)